MSTIEYHIEQKPSTPTLTIKLDISNVDNKTKFSIKGDSTDLKIALDLKNTPASIIAAFLTLGISQAVLESTGDTIAGKVNDKLPELVKEINISNDITDRLTYKFDIGGVGMSVKADGLSLRDYQGALMLGGSLKLS